MLIQKVEKRWETRPLDCWAKAKELRAKYLQGEAEAEALGRILTEGMDATTPAGIPLCQCTFSQPYGASVAVEGDDFSRQCRAVTEARGYGRDLCGYMLNQFGGMFSNRGLGGNPFSPRKLVQGFGVCDAHNKHSQVVAEYFNAPHFYEERPRYYGDPDPERDEARMNFLVRQKLRQIEWLEKGTGITFDDEAFIETAKSQWRLEALRGEALNYLHCIPAPVDQKSLYSIGILGNVMRSAQDETEQFWKMFRDELKWRTENQIAALATERYRWVEQEPPPWTYLSYYRYMEQYGAVCLHAYYHFIDWQEQPDGTFTRPLTPIDRGEPLDTREDIVRAYVREECGASGSSGALHGPVHEMYYNMIRKYFRHYRADGVFLALYRSGLGCSVNMREAAMMFSEAGIPVGHYETSHPGNLTDFDRNRLLDQLDTFMESQGLRKLED